MEDAPQTSTALKIAFPLNIVAVLASLLQLGLVFFFGGEYTEGPTAAIFTVGGVAVVAALVAAILNTIGMIRQGKKSTRVLGCLQTLIVPGLIGIPWFLLFIFVAGAAH